MGSSDNHELDSCRGYSQLKYVALVAVVALLLMAVVKSDASAQANARREEVRLGARLFSDERFSSPKGDLVSSCSHCHLYDEAPDQARAFTDSFARSWVPWRTKDPRREGARNAPTLFDVAEMSPLHFDGEFNSLEALVTGTLTGRTFGWLPGEERDARQQIYQVITKDSQDNPNANGSYREQFKNVYGVDLEKLDQGQTLDLIARAISAYMRTLKSARTSPYDQFMQMNGLATRPAQGETPAVFARRLLARIAALETQRKLQTPAGFDTDAIAGMKIFFRTEGAASVGNCVSCHAPPLFTDASFHNLGVTQSEYDQVHSDGSFAALKIPNLAEAVRPAANFREVASASKPGNADLGYWNFVRLADSSLRRAGESDSQLLQRMIATFKTPTLRSLAYSQPYMHNGTFASLESALAEIMRLSAMARAGRIREADAELAGIKITAADLPRLIAFLNTLNEDLNRRLPIAER